MANKQSKMSKQGQEYLAKHPQTTAATLAKLFDMHVSTVYHSPWWKNREFKREGNQK